MNELGKKTPAGAVLLEKVIIEGDLSKLTPAERLDYYRRVCDSLGLNPLTRPFEYLWLPGGPRGEDGGEGKRLVLYVKRDATEQLRKIHGVSVTSLEAELVEGIYVVTAKVRDKEGREDSDIGAVPIDQLRGVFRANAMKKSITQAKRRATLSIVGLGWLDESEVEDVPDGAPAQVNPATGEVERAGGSAREAQGSPPPSGSGVAPSSLSFLVESPKSKAFSRLMDTMASKGLTSAQLTKLAHDTFKVKTVNDLTAVQMDELAEEIGG